MFCKQGRRTCPAGTGIAATHLHESTGKRAGEIFAPPVARANTAHSSDPQLQCEITIFVSRDAGIDSLHEQVAGAANFEALAPSAECAGRLGMVPTAAAQMTSKKVARAIPRLVLITKPSTVWEKRPRLRGLPIPALGAKSTHVVARRKLSIQSCRSAASPRSNLLLLSASRQQSAALETNHKLPNIQRPYLSPRRLAMD